MAQMIKHGPVDVVAIAVGEPRFEGKVLAELEKQAKAGVIRVLDALILLKDENGRPWRMDIRDLPKEQAAAVGFIEEDTLGLFDEEDASTFFEGMVPGSGVFALAIEHLWAVDLANALVDSGAEIALNFRVPAMVVDEAFTSLEASN
jgi:hypothetical protein